ncbi:helix-turn-helix domain-containing protein [Sphingomonas azotifigens]|uniref:helix-turn-helix domain-containing protein n=1 Tax=Sphingomonas azotifigens TaxID=330920 RepID=UPI0009FCE5FF|nr:helix-turn-helix domain-containing protein [Sphingomonas azotifigens]
MDVATPRVATRKHRMPEVVKSAVRVLEILEYFDRRRGAATVGDVANDLGYPQSSTSALMRSLVAVGYLSYDAHERAFLPTHRLPLLGCWLGEPFFQEGPVLTVAREIADRTNFAVGIARRNANKLQWMTACTTTDMSVDDVFASATSLLHSAVGLSLMASLDDRQVRALIHRLNAEVADLADVVPPAELIARIADIRRDRHVFSDEGGTAMLAMTTPSSDGVESVSIAIVDRSGLLAEHLTETISIARDCIARLNGAYPPPGTLAFRNQANRHRAVLPVLHQLQAVAG